MISSFSINESMSAIRLLITLTFFDERFTVLTRWTVGSGWDEPDLDEFIVRVRLYISDISRRQDR